MLTPGPAFGRKGNHAAARSLRLKHFAHAGEWPHTVEVFVFIDLCLGPQDLLPLFALKA